MNDYITIAVGCRLAARAAALVARWQWRLLGRLQAGDSLARQAGWTVTPARFGGRIYRDPRFGQFTARHAPEPSHQTAPPGSIAGGIP
jgi:hypothetical protein